MSKKMTKVDITKIKLAYKNVPGAGKQIYANVGQEVPCIEFTLKGDVPQPVMTTSRNAPEFLVFYENWIQFEPEAWSNMIDEMFEEMVKLWNAKHGKDLK